TAGPSPHASVTILEGAGPGRFTRWRSPSGTAAARRPGTARGSVINIRTAARAPRPGAARSASASPVLARASAVRRRRDRAPPDRRLDRALLVLYGVPVAAFCMVIGPSLPRCELLPQSR